MLAVTSQGLQKQQHCLQSSLHSCFMSLHRAAFSHAACFRTFGRNEPCRMVPLPLNTMQSVVCQSAVIASGQLQNKYRNRHELPIELPMARSGHTCPATCLSHRFLVGPSLERVEHITNTPQTSQAHDRLPYVPHRTVLPPRRVA